MTNKQKRELTWVGKETRPKLEPRILLEDKAKSYHAKHRVGENDRFDNRPIFGYRLLALKSLRQDFAGKVKCVHSGCIKRKDPDAGNKFAEYLPYWT
jgi:adenine-specific DNA-methyltransferase